MRRTFITRVRKGGLLSIPWGRAESGNLEDARRVFSHVAELLESGAGLTEEDRSRLVAFFDRLGDGLDLKSGKKRGAPRKGGAVRDNALASIRKASPKTQADLSVVINKIAKQAGVTRETMQAEINRQLQAEEQKPQWPAPIVSRLSYEELRAKYPDMGHEFWAWASKLD